MSVLCWWSGAGQEERQQQALLLNARETFKQLQPDLDLSKRTKMAKSSVRKGRKHIQVDALYRRRYALLIHDVFVRSSARIVLILEF